MPIRSIDSDEYIQGIPDQYGKQEIKANSLGSQILSRHGYFTFKLLNFNSNLFPDVDFDLGIDEEIFRSKIPKDDPLQLSQLKSHYDNMTITIDYKSNNLKDPNSIYVKLKPYDHQNKYFEYIRKDIKINPILKNWNSKYADKYYSNHQILARSNRSDLMVYLKYEKYPDYFELNQAYLIGRKTLKLQVLDILNHILAEAKYPPIKYGEESFRLNQKITKAYMKVQEDPTILKKDMELVKIKKHRYDNGDIMLKIPERYLYSYIKVDENGEIIFSDIDDFNSK